MKMKKTKKIVAMILAFAMMTGCGTILTGCGSDSETASQAPGDIHLTVKVPQLTLQPECDKDCKTSAQFLEKALADFTEQYTDANVSYDVVEFDIAEGWEDAIEGSFDKDNATDLLFGGYLNISSYLYTGKVVPLDDIITDEMKADIEESNWEQSKAVKNGKIYMMPFMSYQNHVLYNKDMFRNAGLDRFIGEDNTIQSWSDDEWQTILEALKSNAPTGTFPMAMYAANNQGDTHIMTLARAAGSSFFDNKGYFNLNTHEGIAGLQFIKDGVDKGYFPTHAETLEIQDCTTLFMDGQLGMTFLNNSFDESTVDFEVGHANFPGNIATSFLSGFEVFDNGDSEKIQICKDFLTFVYGNEELMEYSTGAVLPVSKRIAKKYANEIHMLDAYSANDTNVVDFCRNNPNWMGVRAAFFPHIAALLSGDETAAEAAKGIDRDCNAAIDIGYNEADDLHE